MSLNRSVYAPSDVLNAPALLYAGQGQPLTPYFVQVANNTSFTIPTSAITWSITANGTGTCTVNGVAMSGAISLSGSGPLFTPITIADTTDNVYVSYTLNNVVYNVPGNY
jgi:hypothetical protein